MSYTALYRKYRPNNFANVVGQDTVVEILRNSIKANHISHAYLFTGPRGTGKTSIAKIFAHAINCKNFTDDVCGVCETCKYLETNDTDIIEIDAASNNGVEEIRTLRDNVKLLPTYCKYKIYIVDEVHMLTTSAFNALLKTLEEPPQHVVFILATTEPHKIPLTILSRCQRFDFNKIEENVLVNRLKYILQCENNTMSDDVLQYIAKVSDGGLRDAINLLDQSLSLSKNEITVSDIERLSGKISNKDVFQFIDFCVASKYADLLDLVQKMSHEGKSYADITHQLLIIFRDYVINKQVSNYFDKDYSSMLSKYDFSIQEVLDISKILNELLNEMKNTSEQKVLFEIYIMNISTLMNSKRETISSNSQKEKIENVIINNEISENSQDNIVLEENNTQKEEISEEVVQEEIKSNVNIENLKKIRINNVLAEADKSVLMQINANYDRINDFISNKIYNTIAALLIDGKVVVASNEYLLFAFPDETYLQMFDMNYKQIELFMNEIFDKPYKVVAVSMKRWEEIRNEFIINKKNNILYVKIPENDVKLEVSDSLSELENSALDLFGENTISVK